MPDSKLILVNGATGYAGGRLVPRVLATGYRVRCLVRQILSRGAELLPRCRWRPHRRLKPQAETDNPAKRRLAGHAINVRVTSLKALFNFNGT